MAQERGQREHRTAGHSLMLTEVLQQVVGIYIYGHGKMKSQRLIIALLVKFMLPRLTCPGKKSMYESRS